MPYNPKELMKKILAGSEYRLKGSVKGRVRVAGRDGAIVNFTAADFGVQSLSDKIILSGEQFDRFRARIFGILNAGGDEISNRITTGLTPKKRYRSNVSRGMHSSKPRYAGGFDASEAWDTARSGTPQAAVFDANGESVFYTDRTSEACAFGDGTFEANGDLYAQNFNGIAIDEPRARDFENLYALDINGGSGALNFSVAADDDMSGSEDDLYGSDGDMSGDLHASNFKGGSRAVSLRAERGELNLSSASIFDGRGFEHAGLYDDERRGFCGDERDFGEPYAELCASAAPQDKYFLAPDETEDLKFAPQKTAQIPISRGDGASFSDMILNLAINFEQNSKDSDLARSKAARSQDAQTAHGQNFNGARRFSSGAQEAPGGAQKIASGGEGILKDARGVLSGAQEGCGDEKNLAPRIKISTAEGFVPQTKALQGAAVGEQSEKFDASRAGDEWLAKPTQIVSGERLAKPARAASLGCLSKPAQIDDDRLIKPTEAAEGGRSVELAENVEDERLIPVQTIRNERFARSAANLKGAASSLKPVRAKKAANFPFAERLENSTIPPSAQQRENFAVIPLAAQPANSPLPPTKPARPAMLAGRPAASKAARIIELKPRFIGIAHRIKISFLKKSASEPGEGVLARVRIPLLMENFGLNDILSSKSNYQMAKKMVRTIADLYIAKDLRGVHIDVPVRLEMGFKSGISDVSNHAFIFKLVEDSLVNNGVIDDDNADIVREIKLFKQDVFDGVLVNIVRSE